MCLYPRTNHIMIAGRDIVVYKSFDRDSAEIVCSPYMETKWRVGETKSVSSFGDDDNPKRRFKKRLPKYGRVTIGRGLHAFQRKRDAKTCVGNVIGRCIIPKGTPYIVGYNDIVSLKLKLEKIVR